MEDIKAVKLYKSLENDFDNLGKEDEFVNRVRNREEADKLYESIKDKYDNVGKDADEFYKIISSDINEYKPKVATTTPTPTPATSTNDVLPKQNNGQSQWTSQSGFVIPEDKYNQFKFVNPFDAPNQTEQPKRKAEIIVDYSDFVNKKKAQEYMKGYDADDNFTYLRNQFISGDFTPSQWEKTYTDDVNTFKQEVAEADMLTDETEKQKAKMAASRKAITSIWDKEVDRLQKTALSGKSSFSGNAEEEFNKKMHSDEAFASQVLQDRKDFFQYNQGAREFQSGLKEGLSTFLTLYDGEVSSKLATIDEEEQEKLNSIPPIFAAAKGTMEGEVRRIKNQAQQERLGAMYDETLKAMEKWISDNKSLAFLNEPMAQVNIRAAANKLNISDADYINFVLLPKVYESVDEKGIQLLAEKYGLNATDFMSVFKRSIRGSVLGSMYDWLCNPTTEVYRKARMVGDAEANEAVRGSGMDLVGTGIQFLADIPIFYVGGKVANTAAKSVAKQIIQNYMRRRGLDAITSEAQKKAIARLVQMGLESKLGITSGLQLATMLTSSVINMGVYTGLADAASQLSNLHTLDPLQSFESAVKGGIIMGGTLGASGILGRSLVNSLGLDFTKQSLSFFKNGSITPREFLGEYGRGMFGKGINFGIEGLGFGGGEYLSELNEGADNPDFWSSVANAYVKLPVMKLASGNTFKRLWKLGKGTYNKQGFLDTILNMQANPNTFNKADRAELEKAINDPEHPLSVFAQKIMENADKYNEVLKTTEAGSEEQRQQIIELGNSDAEAVRELYNAKDIKLETRQKLVAAMRGLNSWLKPTEFKVTREGNEVSVRNINDQLIDVKQFKDEESATKYEQSKREEMLSARNKDIEDCNEAALAQFNNSNDWFAIKSVIDENPEEALFACQALEDGLNAEQKAAAESYAMSVATKKVWNNIDQGIEQSPETLVINNFYQNPSHGTRDLAILQEERDRNVQTIAEGNEINAMAVFAADTAERIETLLNDAKAAGASNKQIVNITRLLETQKKIEIVESLLRNFDAIKVGSIVPLADGSYARIKTIDKENGLMLDENDNAIYNDNLGNAFDRNIYSGSTSVKAIDRMQSLIQKKLGLLADFIHGNGENAKQMLVKNRQTAAEIASVVKIPSGYKKPLHELTIDEFNKFDFRKNNNQDVVNKLIEIAENNDIVSSVMKYRAGAVGKNAERREKARISELTDKDGNVTIAKYSYTEEGKEQTLEVFVKDSNPDTSTIIDKSGKARQVSTSSLKEMQTRNAEDYVNESVSIIKQMETERLQKLTDPSLKVGDEITLDNEGNKGIVTEISPDGQVAIEKKQAVTDESGTHLEPTAETMTLEQAQGLKDAQAASAVKEEPKAEVTPKEAPKEEVKELKIPKGVDGRDDVSKMSPADVAEVYVSKLKERGLASIQLNNESERCKQDIAEIDKELAEVKAKMDALSVDGDLDTYTDNKNMLQKQIDNLQARKDRLTRSQANYKLASDICRGNMDTDAVKEATGTLEQPFRKGMGTKRIQEWNERVKKEGGVMLNEYTEGVDDGILNTLNEIGKQVGYTIFYGKSTLGANGEWNGESRTIMIDVNSKEPIEFIIGHELTHMLKNNTEKDIWNGYVSAVRSTLGYDEFNRRVQDILSTYNPVLEKAGRAQIDHLGAIEELCADYAGQEIFSNREFVSNLLNNVANHPEEADKIIGRVRSFINNICKSLRKVTNPTALDKQKLKKYEGARKIWGDMYAISAARKGNRKPLIDEISKAMGEKTQDTDGIDTDIRKESISAMAEGAGLIGVRRDEDGIALAPITDAEGNVAFELNGVLYTGHNHLTPELLKANKNTALSYMIEDAKFFKTINPEQEERIWKKYTDILNRALDKGLVDNGGWEGLSNDWQWIAETAYKAVASNSDSQYKFSADITRVCKKNEQIIKAMSYAQVHYGYGLTPSQIFDLYAITYEKGYQVPCPVCYVFSRYINNGQYASIMINGQKMYGKYLKDPAKMTEKERVKALEFWKNEHLKRQKEYDPKLCDTEEEKKAAKINKSALEQAKKDISEILEEIDKIGFATGLKREKGESTEREEQIIKALDDRYRAALNVVANAALDAWIRSFALKITTSNDVKHYRLYTAEEQGDLYKDGGFDKKYALDLRESAEVIRRYPAIQRFRSRGSATGKEIAFESNNDIGEFTMMLGNLKAGNYYKFAIEAKTDKEREKWLKKARERFQGAHNYVQQQSLRGGQRMWSWSDNIERLAPDVAVNLLQLELLGGALQSYSKQLEGIKLVASMDGYVNGSLMGRGLGYEEIGDDNIEVVNGVKVVKNDIKYYNEYKKKYVPSVIKGAPIYELNGKKYTLAFDDVTGIQAYDEKVGDKVYKGLFTLNNELDRAGNILVGVNDIHILSALADPRIFFVIPWHASGLSQHNLAQMLNALKVYVDTTKFQDYTKVQEEKVISLPMKGGDKNTDLVSGFLVKLWESHKNEKDFACGIKGGIKSGENGRLSQSQVHYRELRDAIFLGVEVVDEKGKSTFVDVKEAKPEWYKEIMKDEFLKQVYDKVNKNVEIKRMTKDDTNSIYPYEYWDESSVYKPESELKEGEKSANVNGARYLEYCRRLGRKPKFCGLLNEKAAKGEDFGNFTDADGYWKVLIDRRMYDNDGKFQDLTSVSTRGLEVDYIDPQKTKEEFIVTEVAKDEDIPKIFKKFDNLQKTRTESGRAFPIYGTPFTTAAKDYLKTKPVKEIIREANKLKLTDENGNKIKFSVTPQQDAEYLEAVDRKDEDKASVMVKEAVKAAMPNTKVVDADGNPLVVYHGTGRADRVGNIFDPNRATSGPMAMFTDNKRIAENYAKDKNDTSIAYDKELSKLSEGYNQQFRAGKGFGKSIESLWYSLPYTTRNEISKKAGSVRTNWKEGDGSDIIYDADTHDANGGWDWQLNQEAKGNAIKALIIQWLNSGNLFRDEDKFLKVLELSGVSQAMKDAGYGDIRRYDPYYRNEKVYSVYMDLKNPFYTYNDYNKKWLNGFKKWWSKQDESKYEKESENADDYDKNSKSIDEWIEEAEADVENGKSWAFVTIPDAVSDYLKYQGYDGIKDGGGKFNNTEHSVYIPFYSEQIKSADPITYDNNGEVIPLSKRFDKADNDIRYSVTNNDEETMHINQMVREAMPEEVDVKFSLRTKEAPKEIKPVYKLMRLGKDGLLYPLYIDRNTQGLEMNKWYDADSPEIKDLLNLEAGYSYLIDKYGNVVDKISGLEGIERKFKGNKPSKEQIYDAASKNQRWIGITYYANGEKCYSNFGISGSSKNERGEGNVSGFAMRPGWHAGSLPSMKQISARSDDMVWVKGFVAYGNGAPEEAAKRPKHEIVDHIPVDGGYKKATSSFNEKNVDWYISGAFMPTEIISDAEARRVIDKYNADNEGMKVPYDIERPDGKIFDGKKIVRFSLAEGAEQTEEQMEQVKKLNAKQPKTTKNVVNVDDIRTEDYEGGDKLSLTRRTEETIDSWLNKRTDFDEDEKSSFKNLLHTTFEDFNPNEHLAIGKWFVEGKVRYPEDIPMTNDGIVLARKMNVQPSEFETPAAIQVEYFKRHEKEIPNELLLSPDDRRFSGILIDKIDYGNGLVIYTLNESERGQNACQDAVRELMNDHMGKNFNCWCLEYADADGKINSSGRSYWRNYSSVPKRVAFYNGKIQSFCASNSGYAEWWDLHDMSHNGIVCEAKIPNDRLGRSGVVEFNPETGESNGVTKEGLIYKGNKKNGYYYEWYSMEENSIKKKYNYKGGEYDGVQEHYYDDGQLEVRLNYKDGKLDGVWKKYYDNGQLRERKNYKDGKQDGVQEEYYDNGQLRLRINYKDGNRDGVQEEYYDNGQLRLRINYKDDKLDGVREKYYDNGQLLERTNYKDDNRDGVWEKYYDNGQLLERTNYKDGNRDGVWEKYYDNGKLQSRINYKDGKQDGVREKYYDNGQLVERANYKDGKQDGVQEEYYDNGQLRFRLNYKDGNRDGVWEEYYDNGQLRLRINYKDGSRDGVWEEYYKDGKLQSRTNYKDGKLDGVQDNYLTNGQLVARFVYKNGIKVGETDYDNQGTRLSLTNEEIKTITPSVTTDDYWKATEVDFKSLKADGESYADLWFKMREEHPEWEYKKSPINGSNSQYLIDKGNGVIYRHSDHWGEVASCNWTLDGNSSDETKIASAPIADFERKEFFVELADRLRFADEHKEYNKSVDDYNQSLWNEYNQYRSRVFDNDITLSNGDVARWNNGTYEVYMDGDNGKPLNVFTTKSNAELNERRIADRSELAEVMPSVMTYDEWLEFSGKELKQRMSYDNQDDVKYSFRRFGGNSGYIGYSKSRRAAQAEAEGKRSISNFDDEFVDSVNDEIGKYGLTPLSKAKIKNIAKSKVSPTEWHHTSMYGNRTNYYSPEDIADYIISQDAEASRLRDEEIEASRLREEKEREYYTNVIEPIEKENNIVRQKYRDYLRTIFKQEIELPNGDIAKWESFNSHNYLFFKDGKQITRKGNSARLREDRELLDKATQTLGIREWAKQNGVEYKEIPEWNEETRFSISVSNADPFYSNAAKAVEKITQPKATPEQWKAMIEKNGGLKKEEDKWMGLTEWLTQQKALAMIGERPNTITKEEIEKFIADNSVKIEEVNYTSLEETPKFQEFKKEFDSFAERARRDGAYERASQKAFDEMVSKYGDDFELAFSTDGDGELIVSTDFSGNPSDAAIYFLLEGESNNKLVNQIRLEYTTRGLTNKREIALVAPQVDQYKEGDEIHFGDAGEGRAVVWVRFGDARTPNQSKEMQSLQDEFRKLKSKENRSPEDNQRIKEILDRVWELKDSGEKVLVIDEIQSKRHQDGREKGYDSDYENSARGKHEKAINEFVAYERQMLEKYGFEFSTRMTEEESKKHSELKKNLYEAGSSTMNDKKSYNIPDAPFRNNWHELAIKRMLRYAAENGYDKIAWTTGEQQNRRYDLDKYVDTITSERNENGNMDVNITLKDFDSQETTLEVDKNGKIVRNDSYNDITGDLTDKYLYEVIGKPLAEKVLAEEVWLQNPDLKFENKGMLSFYDKILPQFMNKYGKKWGVSVKDVELKLPYKDDRVMHSVDVTEPMKESVLAEGQSMFSITNPEDAQKINPKDVFKLTPEEEMIEELRLKAEDEKEATEVAEQTDANADRMRGEIIVNSNPFLFCQDCGIDTTPNGIRRAIRDAVKQRRSMIGVQGFKDVQLIKEIKRLLSDKPERWLDKLVVNIDDFVNKETTNGKTDEEYFDELMLKYFQDEGFTGDFAKAQMKAQIFFDGTYQSILQHNMMTPTSRNKSLEHFIKSVWDRESNPEVYDMLMKAFNKNPKRLCQFYNYLTPESLYRLIIDDVAKELPKVVGENEKITNEEAEKRLIDEVGTLKLRYTRLTDLMNDYGARLTEAIADNDFIKTLRMYTIDGKPLVIRNDIDNDREGKRKAMINLLNEQDYAEINGIFKNIPEGLKISNRKLIRMIEGTQEVPQEAQEFIKRIRMWFDAKFDMLDSAGMFPYKDGGYLENYLTHIWDKEKSDVEAWKQYVDEPDNTYVGLPMNSGFSKPRTFASYEEGIAAGLVPMFKSVKDIMKYYANYQNNRVVNNISGQWENTREMLIKSGASQYEYIPLKEGSDTDWLVHKDFKKLTDVVFAKGDKANWFNLTGGFMKQMVLGLSGFHIVALSEGLVSNASPAKAMWSGLKNVWIDSMRTQQMPADIRPEVTEDALRHLVKLGGSTDYNRAQLQSLFDKWDNYLKAQVTKNLKGNAAQKAAGAAESLVRLCTLIVKDMHNANNAVLWDMVHDGYKIVTYDLRSKAIRATAAKKGWSEAEVNRRLDELGVWINDSFGGQNWDVIGISQKTKKNLDKWLLSSDWTISTMFRQAGALFGFGTDNPYDINTKEYWKHTFWQTDDSRRRSKMAIQFFARGLAFFAFLYNSINAYKRREDELEEKAKAEEIRNTQDPNYKSVYELAYPDGMKWYDYTMYGNAQGNKTYLFWGRFDDGTEKYVRVGKQYRELPEMVLDKSWKSPYVNVPWAAVDKMRGKLNPWLTTILEALGGAVDTRWVNDDIKKAEGMYERTKAFTKFFVNQFVPYSLRNNDIELINFFLPTSKGLTPYKAKEALYKLFEKQVEGALERDDQDALMDIYKACTLGKLDFESLFEAAQKNVYTNYRKSKMKGVASLEDAMSQYNSETDMVRKNQLKNYIIRETERKDFNMVNREQAEGMWQDMLEGYMPTKKEGELYLKYSTTEDLLQDNRLRNYKQRFEKDSKAYKVATKYQSGITRLKRNLENFPEETMNKIRELRLKAFEAIDKAVEAEK